MPTQEEIVQALGQMSVMQLISLTRELEDRWGIKLEPVPLPGIHSLEVEPVQSARQQEQTEFSVLLVAIGEKRFDVIRAVRTAIGLGLREAKDLVESGLPKPVKEGLDKTSAEMLKSQLEAAGAVVELK
jgi:large subunit ribosomal protein L7/L12